MSLPAGGTEVSVALCTRNGGLYVRQQVQSICAQTQPPDEIVLSDDASSDTTVALVKEAIDERNAHQATVGVAPIRLRILRNPVALGPARNFEQAVAVCSSALIALSDQDDVWRPDRLARMAAEFRRRPGLLLLHSDASRSDAEGHGLGHSLFEALEVRPWELARIHGGEAFDVYLRRNLVTGATAMFRHSVLRFALPFPDEWLHDEWLGIIAAAVGEVDALEERLVAYRQHEGNLIGAARLGTRQKIRRALGSRGTIHVERARKAEVLLERLVSLGDSVKAGTLSKVREKLEHQRFRAQLPPSRVQRVQPILREALAGRYAKFGRGFLGVVRDLLEGV